ncbi:MAG TPA: peptide ABC transporter substrate-binding protein [Lentisphaeria bacterium]|nr:MAG: peptide ABC transporter substrate-binding protein [Lentisphaerae bacterium GWF2_38_69]HBM16937.1 peptide ABC transporter substrate-binding protein [Lentisphaeria bacterium]
MKNFYNFAVIVMLIVTLAAVGCSKKEANLKKASQKGILYVGNGSEPQDIDPQTVTGVPEQRIISALFEGLLSENPETLEPEPALAESWSVSPDSLTYTFKLRDNLKWSNRDPITANDFVYAYKRILSPALGSQNAYMLYCMKNAEKYNKRIIADFSEVGVKALDDNTLQIKLARPTPYFLSLVTHMAWFPIDKNAIEKFGTMDQRGTKWTLPGNLVCDGPFVLKNWEVNKVITVVKNPLYWDARNVKLNQIEFFPISDNQAEERTFRAGQLHITYTVPSSKIDYYQKNKSDLIHISPYMGTYYMVFNVNKYPFDSALVRKALSLAIDRKSLAEDVVKGGKQPANSFTPPNTGDYTAKTNLPYDVKFARECLANAGYPDGKGFPTIELMYNTSERNRQIAEAIQAMWQSNLNIKVELVNKEWKMYLDSFRTRDFSIAAASWIGDYNDPLTFLGMWTSDSTNNRARWSNSQYDKLIEDASVLSDQATRYDYFNEAEKLLMDQMPVMPLYYYTSMALISPDVKGWHPNILDHHPYKYMSLSDSANIR